MAGREPDGLYEHREKQARAAEARLAAVLDSVHDGVWVLDAEGRALLANHRLGQLFGVRPQELGAGVRQREALERLRSSFADPRQALARWRQLEERPEEVVWDEIELRRPHRRILERFARPFSADNRLLGRIEVYRDITPERLLEDKVLQREKLAAVGQLVSGIAHELNNPLTAVTGYAQLLAGAPLPPELTDKAERLRQEAERAGRIVSNLLLFARGGKAEKQLVRIEDIVERSLSLRAYELKVENIEVVRELPADLPPVLADTQFCVELGRYLVGEAGVYLTRIVDRKISHGEVFLITDGGLHHQLAASGNFGTVVRRNYPVAIASKFGAPIDEQASVVGCLCTPLDRLADKAGFPRAEVGDLVAVFCAGAYGATASPAQFLGHGPAREMLV
ncbi:MAG: histidine kinase dimerization/phospho-acceptor domain-containing protein [Burkholderiales bacterium]